MVWMLMVASATGAVVDAAAIPAGIRAAAVHVAAATAT
jgi:hypothetical protein